ncbi:MAG: Holliday junction branch migration protein RuvA [Clostridiales bacterium]|jgi:Holliday junction DNA helicase RuvA|nr:Holliday junction branch migration protein RuvA [Clostridiales bacterium]
MISYIIGRVAEVGEGALVLECNNLGYFVNISNSTAARLSVGADVKLHTSLQIKENDISLIGFLSGEEAQIFAMLTSVSGVGTKAALAIQSVLDSSGIILAILTEEVDELTRAVGVGKKLASRIILELKDKLKSSEISYNIAPQQNIGAGNATAKQEATDALTNLGYSRNEALRVVMEVALTDMTAEQIIRQSLKKLAM